MTDKEQRQLMVLGRVDRGVVQIGEAAQVLELSERHVLRLLAAYRKEGASALVHGNRGRQPAHDIPMQIRDEVSALARGRLAGITTCVAATDFVATFLPRYNARFAAPAAVPGSACLSPARWHHHLGTNLLIQVCAHRGSRQYGPAE